MSNGASEQPHLAFKLWESIDGWAPQRKEVMAFGTSLKSDANARDIVSITSANSKGASQVMLIPYRVRWFHPMALMGELHRVSVWKWVLWAT